ncbi:MAG: hypothetical protein M3Z08_21405 [Chloroflexota bacterium]|nr:hypothetical protein [Chloroflexota bacterium]
MEPRNEWDVERQEAPTGQHSQSEMAWLARLGLEQLNSFATLVGEKLAKWPGLPIRG